MTAAPSSEWFVSETEFPATDPCACSPTQELVTALHGLTLLYEKQFHIAALHFSEGKRISATNLTTSVTPTGWIHATIDPLESNAASEGGTPSANIQPPPSPTALSSSLPGKHAVGDGLENHAHHNGELVQSSSVSDHSLPPTLGRGTLANGEGGAEARKQFLEDLPKGKQASGAGLSTRNWYQQIWRGMVYLASDPFPKVADLAQHMVHGLHDKVS